MPVEKVLPVEARTGRRLINGIERRFDELERLHTDHQKLGQDVAFDELDICRAAPRAGKHQLALAGGTEHDAEQGRCRSYLHGGIASATAQAQDGHGSPPATRRPLVERAVTASVPQGHAPPRPIAPLPLRGRSHHPNAAAPRAVTDDRACPVIADDT